MRAGTILLATTLALAAGCTAPGGPGSASDLDWNKALDGGATASDGAAGEVLAPPPVALTPECQPAQASDSLPPRLAIISASADKPPPVSVPKEQPFFVSDLYSLFNSYCGGCHVNGSQGGFHVNGAASFSADMARDLVLGAIQAEDPLKVMPPGSPPFSQRNMSDPVLDFLHKLQIWFDQGKPAGILYLPPDMAEPAPAPPAAGQPVADYHVSDTIAAQLTNVGSCVPNRAMYASLTTPMDQLDQAFSQATVLPKSLADTDLVSLDSAVLAQQGVVGFVPTYPLFSEGSYKMRAIRVPRGQSIHFDKQDQRFEIPPNTRFYKTFLKKIKDVDGTYRFRKIETRLIVARPDQPQQDGTSTVTALFGTYAWNDEETEARLVEDPLLDQKPFKDRLITYVTDEVLAKQVRDKVHADGDKVDLKFALDDQHPGLLRRYAIPGSERCIECHMGSPSSDFVLGFTPLQISRRPEGQGGIYETPGPDELTQLRRLIDLGVITGVASASDILPLEGSQGSRVPRNDLELQAQAYITGNCAHCHNPRGFPSVKQPLLKEALNFLPGPEGGVFQFPLDRVSPVRKRGSDQSVGIPYITPSLRDLNPTAVNPSALVSGFWTAKAVSCTGDKGDPFCPPGRTDDLYIDAPWRSLIYRNVDTPFIYAEDFAIFPHMPRNSAGFDCRITQIMGSWMVSIPSKRVNPKIPEEIDPAVQPYLEVSPGDPAYAEANTAADQRLAAYRAGKRYGFCPDTTDIVDPVVVAAGGTDPNHLAPSDEVIFDPNDSSKWLMPQDGVPDRPHWVVSDTTDPPGDWFPRNSDWQMSLVDPRPLVRTPDDPAAIDTPTALGGLVITPEMRTFARSTLPLGLWTVKPECKFTGIPTVGSLGAGMPDWAAKADPGAPLYTVTPGEAVFGEICINCHGPKADAKGLMAETISEMTGGQARVANFRDGFLGPVSMPGGNRDRAFGITTHPITGPVPTAEDWAGRYMAWMALGGTKAHLPQSILNIVATTPVLGVRRVGFYVAGSPNMLQVGRDLCALALPMNSIGQLVDFQSFFKGAPGGKMKWDDERSFLSGLITANGDAELWVRLCNMDNPVVRVLSFDSNGKAWIDPLSSFYWATPQSYPDSAPVLNHLGQVVNGIHTYDDGPNAANLMPVCVRQPLKCASGSDPCGACKDSELAACMGASDAHGNLYHAPWCPESLFATDDKGTSKYLFKSIPPNTLGNGKTIWVDADVWTTRGAANAGLSVFLYLQDLESGKLSPRPAYNQCEKLAQ